MLFIKLAQEKVHINHWPSHVSTSVELETDGDGHHLPLRSIFVVMFYYRVFCHAILKYKKDMQTLNCETTI